MYSIELHNEKMDICLKDARAMRSAYLSGLIKAAVKAITSALQVELPSAIPGPLAHR